MQWTQWDSETSVGLVRHARAVEAIVGVLYSMYRYIYMCVVCVRERECVYVCVWGGERGGGGGACAPRRNTIVMQNVTVHILIIIIINRFYIALFSAREQTHCARM